MTLLEALHFGRQRLRSAGVPDHEYDAGALLQYAADVSMAQILGDPGRELAPEALTRYLEMVGKREKRIPLQHIVGETCFYGYMFSTREGALIPRSDTEHLVEQALMLAPERPVRFLDLCTGTGCIGISFFLERRARGFRDEGILTDLSEAALALAEENAERLHAEVSLVHSDLFDGLKGELFDIIMSNPPYISLSEMETLMPEVKDHDPRMALTDEGDGLLFYRRIAYEAEEHLKPGGQLFLEIGSGQRNAVEKLLSDKGFTDISCRQDYAGLDRVVYAKTRRI